MLPKQSMYWCKRWSGFLRTEQIFLTRTEQTFFADWADFFCGLSTLFFTDWADFFRGLSRLFDNDWADWQTVMITVMTSLKAIGFYFWLPMETLKKSSCRIILHALPKQLTRSNLWKLEFSSMNSDDSSKCVIIYVIMQWNGACIWFLKTTFPQ